jgi:hypothetical protein
MRRPAAMAALCAALAWAAVAAAESPPDFHEEPDRPDGIHILDGSCVLDAGRLHVNITNHGLIGSKYSTTLPYADAPSAQWPAGSGDEYLFAAGLWIGARIAGTTVVTTGQPERELRPGDDIRDTIYEARERYVTRPYEGSEVQGARLPDTHPDDDDDGLMDEDPLNGYDDDDDGLVDEDFGQRGSQMFVATMRDDGPLVRELYPDHVPLGVKVVQRAMAWSEPGNRDFIGLDYEIHNSSARTLDDVYLGFYVDGDIQNRGGGSPQPDDLTGYFDGAMADEFGVYHRLQVGWMRDADPDDPLPGYIGVMLLDHDTDFRDISAPHLARVRTYQAFASMASHFQEGEPTTDPERYAMMAERTSDPDAREDYPGDYKFVISSGPFTDFDPGDVLHYRIAIVMGDGLQDMLENALQASLLQRGRWFNLVNEQGAGTSSHETRVCLGDYPLDSNGEDPLFQYRTAFMDNSCIGDEPVFGYELIRKDNMFLTPEGRYCIWVNADNCEECFRAVGQECTESNRLYWDMAGYPGYRGALTGLGGRETRFPWVTGSEVPPVPPNMRVQAGDNSVDVFWDDRSEYDPDYQRGVIDFESYRVWRVDHWLRPRGVVEGYAPPPTLWRLLREWDVVNMIPRNLTRLRTPQPLGMNTSLDEIIYRPACLDDPAYDGLAEAMQDFVDADPEGEIRQLESVRLEGGRIRPGYAPLAPWEWAPDVLDTFFAVTPRAEDLDSGVVGKRSVRFYTFHDETIHNGFRGYYAVTATDHALTDTSSYPWWVYPKPPLWAPSGEGVGNEPMANWTSTVARFDAQTPEGREKMGENIYLYPNPVTREALSVFDQQYPTEANPTGIQVVFANLPAAQNTIKIYTAAGDLVAVLDHDGTGVDGGSKAWNLMSRNGQEIVSGIYFFVVQSDHPGFEDVVGRFVVVR